MKYRLWSCARNTLLMSFLHKFIWNWRITCFDSSCQMTCSIWFYFTSLSGLFWTVSILELISDGIELARFGHSLIVLLAHLNWCFWKWASCFVSLGCNFPSLELIEPVLNLWIQLVCIPVDFRLTIRSYILLNLNS